MRKFTSIQTNLASNPQYKRYVNHLVGNSKPFFEEGSLYKMSYPYVKSSADNLIDSIAKVAEFEDKGVKMDEFFDLSVSGLAPTDDMNQKEAVGGYWLTLRNMMASTSAHAFQVNYEEPTIGYTYLKKYLEMYSNILEELKPSDLADTIAINDTHKILSPADLMTVKTSFLSEIKHYNFDDFAVVFQGLLRGFKDFGVEQQFTVEEMITVIDYALGKELNDSSHPTQLFSEFSEFCLERKVDHDSLYRVILQVLEDPYSHQDAFIPDFLFAVANLRVERDESKMARGPKKHLKRVTAPKSWLMHKMGGNFAVRPSTGPHKLRQSIPIQLFLRDKIKVALNGNEAKVILHQKEGLVQINKHVRRDLKYPIGLMDIVDVPKMGSAWRCLYDVKGRFTFVKVKKAESNFILCRIQRKQMGANQIAYLITGDGRTIRFADPAIKMHDTVKFDLEKKQITDVLPFELGNVAYISEGNNRGRVGIVTHISKIDGAHDIVTLKDSRGHTFSTRIEYVFVIGKGDKPVITLPKGDGIALSIIEENENKQE